MKKTSDRAESARKKVLPAAEDLVHTAADLVGPLAEAAAERIGAAADKVSPLAHSAAERLAPLATSAADRVGPLAHSAAEHLGPLAQSAADRVGPLAHRGVEAVSPYAHRGVEAVSPYAQLAAERIGPLVDDARERIGPAVDAARTRVSDDVLPRLSELLTAAAGTPLIVEAASRGKAAIAAVKGAEPPAPPEPEKKGSALKRLAIGAAVLAAAVVVARRFLGSKDSDWQAARPSTPYTPPAPTASAPAAEADVAATEVADTPTEARDDQQEGPSAHSEYLAANGAAEPDQPAEGGEAEAVDDHAVTPVEPVEGTTPEDGLVLEPEPVVQDELSTDSRTTSADEVVPPAEADSEPDSAFGSAPGATVERGSDAEPFVVSDPIGEDVLTDETVGHGAGDPASDVENHPLDDLAVDEPVGEGEPPVQVGDDGSGAESQSSRYSGEGVYVGTEPPEGFTIKGNERSMKYHLPSSASWNQTIAEVWFNSEEAAQANGFARAGG